MEESASAEIQEKANALMINVNENSKSHQDRVLLANDITQMLEESSEPLLSPECCIYRVPHVLRKLNEEAYTPQCISIGPFHHGDKRLEAMEKLKVRYFKRFVQKAALNVLNLVSNIRDREGDVRRCYAETSRLSSDNYVKMILVDASFIIVFFLIFKLEEWRGDRDLIVFTPQLILTVIKDMQLLENQLPFFVIKDLYNLAFPSCSTSFTQLTFELFADYNTQKMSPDPNLEIKHFVDLLRTFFLPQSHRLPQRVDDGGVEHLYTASQLHEAGVKFKVSSRECLFDLKFTSGVLEIPRLNLHNHTEFFFRNLMALEQCHYPLKGYVTDYIHVLDYLIDTAKDVDLLVQKGILVNCLGDSNAVTTLVNNLCSQIVYFDMNSDYYNFCKNLNTFYENRCHRSKATLRHYFSTPWRTAFTAIAIFLLGLTLMQTVCSIISTVWKI